MDTNSHINIISHKREFFNAEHPSCRAFFCGMAYFLLFFDSFGHLRNNRRFKAYLWRKWNNCAKQIAKKVVISAQSLTLGYPPLLILRKFTRNLAPVYILKGHRDSTTPCPWVKAYIYWKVDTKLSLRCHQPDTDMTKIMCYYYNRRSWDEKGTAFCNQLKMDNRIATV